MVVFDIGEWEKKIEEEEKKNEKLESFRVTKNSSMMSESRGMELKRESQDSSLDSDNESGEDGVEETEQQQLKPNRRDQELVLLQFLDSTDDYLTLFDSLSAKLRQGWFDLASARHSMGTSRVSTALLDLKIQSAATSLRVDEHDGGSIGTQPFISLRKWTSTEGGECLGEEKYINKLQKQPDNTQLRQRNVTELSDNMGKSSIKKEDTLIIDDQVQKERSRTLSMFGTLVSPKLRSAQLSFENALEIIVEIANKRIAMLSSFDQVKEGLEDTTSFEQVKVKLEDNNV